MTLTPEVVEVEAIIAGGDGLARPADGPVVFLPRTAPGDRVEIERTERHRTWSRGRVLETLQSGPERRDPPCRYYDRCGGCQLQHLTYDAQLRAKRGIVVDALRRLGGIEIDLPPVVPSDLQLGYRNRLSLVLRRDAERAFAGYHAFDAPEHVIDVESCPLAEAPLDRAWANLRRAWGVGAQRLPDGPELRLTLRAGSQGDVGLTIQGGEGYGDPEGLLEAVDNLTSIWWADETGAIDWYVGARTLEDAWGSHRLQLAGLAFVQVNRDVAGKLETYVRDRSGSVQGTRVIDAYCGFGLRALRLAWEGARVVGIDADRFAIAYAEGAAAESGAPARFRAGPVERVLAWELPADLVFLNPPRAGVAAALDALTARPPERLIYVSCDPATLARDLARLASRFAVADCRAFDMFPQTAHVETVVELRRQSRC